MALTKYKLGDLIEQCDDRNSDGVYSLDDVKGISIQKIFIETIKEYVEISESDLKILIEQKSVKDFIERKINNSETINKKISSYTTTKISIEDLQKSIKDNYVKKQIYGTKNIIEISNEAKQEKINLRFDLYK